MTSITSMAQWSTRRNQVIFAVLDVSLNSDKTSKVFLLIIFKGHTTCRLSEYWWTLQWRSGRGAGGGRPGRHLPGAANGQKIVTKIIHMQIQIVSTCLPTKNKKYCRYTSRSASYKRRQPNYTLICGHRRDLSATNYCHHVPCEIR